MKNYSLKIPIVFILIFTLFACDKITNQAPDCKITYPAQSQEFFQGVTVNVSIDATDNENDITEVKLFINDLLRGSVDSSPYILEWNTGDLPFGIYRIKIKCVDASGLESSDEIAVKVVSGGSGEPCPGTETITYGGQVYNTVQIGDQCWLKENLNLGFMIPGEINQTNNDTLEKYCYEDDPANCEIYGGLYQWEELMQYSGINGARGICPEGWHIPTDEEWIILQGIVDSKYGIEDPEWDQEYGRGFDAGKNLKSDTLWHECNPFPFSTDLYGFSALPGGRRNVDGWFFDLYKYTKFSTSTMVEDNRFWVRELDCVNVGISQFSIPIWSHNGMSVRCIKDH